jgi:CRISPR-associated endonuclease Csn1
MTRESNNKTKRENEINKQKYRETKKNQILGLLKESGVEHPSSKLVNKIWLYEQQRGKDAYTGKDLNIDKIIKDQNYVDIDHIIPRSQSFDNSMSNRVLTLQTENSSKINMTPKQYINEALFSKMSNGM